VDAKLEKPLGAAAAAEGDTTGRAERLIGGYWLLAAVGGAIWLWDWIAAWNVPLTLQRPWLALYLVCSFALSQVLYALVARHDGRPFHTRATAIFAVGNGIAETLAFALVYRLGEVLGSSIVGLWAPDWAGLAGFGLGVALFIVYGGVIHAFFWLRVLPPHLDDTPRSRRIRKLRPIAEVALVLGWSLCFWLGRDIWTVVFFHILVDIGLMLKVRPPIFGASRAG
jgi:chlorophyllide a hydrolase